MKSANKTRVPEDADNMTISKRNELDLITRANAGDQSASRRLVDLHKQRLFAFVWRIVRDTDLAEDICQETFLRAFSALKGFKKEFRFSTWLFTIGYRLALNHIRVRSNNNTISYDFSNREAPESTTQIDSALQSEHASRVRKIIWDEVDNLPPAQRATVLMFYREGLSCREVADAMNMPVATVKSHMYRARQKLRARLERHGVDDRDLAYLGA